MLKKFVIYILVLIAPACNNTTTEEILSGIFIPEPSISSALATSSISIEVTFDQKMNKTSIVDAANYTISDDTNDNLEVSSIYVEDDNEQQKIVIISGIQRVNREYRINIKNVMNENGKRVSENGISAVFAGYNVNTVVVLTSPGENEKVFALKAELKWSAEGNIETYLVEVALDREFENQIEESPFTVNAPNNSLEIDLPDAMTYYWRVKACTSEECKTSIPNRFHSIDDSIYVYFPPQELNDITEGNDAIEKEPDDKKNIGNKSYPYQSLERALMEANEYEIINIKIAARGLDQTYKEFIYLNSTSIKRGYNIIGGYTPDFNESSRDPQKNVTIIEGEGENNTFQIDVKNIGVTIDGLTIRGCNTESKDSIAMEIYSSDENLKITNCTIEGGNSLNNSTTAMWIGNSTLDMKNCIIKGGNSINAGTTAMRIANSTLDMKNCIIKGGDATKWEDIVENYTSTCLLNYKSKLNLEKIAIYGGKAMTSVSYGIDNQSGGEIELFNSNIKVGNDNSVYGEGIYNRPDSRFTITNCTVISGKVKNTSRAIRNEGELNIMDSYIVSGSGGISIAISNSNQATIDISKSTVISGYASGEFIMPTPLGLLPFGGSNAVSSEIFIFGCTTRISDSLIISGRAKLYSRGIYNVSLSTSLSSVMNSIIISGPAGDCLLGSGSIGIECGANHILQSNTIINYKSYKNTCGIISGKDNIILNNIVMNALSNNAESYGIYENSTDPLMLLNNLIFYNPADVAYDIANWNLYSDYSIIVEESGKSVGKRETINDQAGPGIGILDGIVDDVVQELNFVADNSTTFTGNEKISGNITLKNSEIIQNVFSIYPDAIVFTGDSDDLDLEYNGTENSIEVESSDINKFHVDDYIEYMADNVPRRITAVDSARNKINFTDSLENTDLVGPGYPVFLWGTRNTGLDEWTVKDDGKADLNGDGLPDIGANSGSVGKK